MSAARAGGAELAAGQVPPGDGGELGHVPGRRGAGGRSPRARARRRPGTAVGDVVGPARGGAGGLDGEQRVAVARLHDLLDRLGRERRDGADERVERRGAERLERELGAERVAGGERPAQRVGLRAAGLLAAGEDEQHACSGRRRPT